MSEYLVLMYEVGNTKCSGSSCYRLGDDGLCGKAWYCQAGIIKLAKPVRKHESLLQHGIVFYLSNIPLLRPDRRESVEEKEGAFAKSEGFMK